MKVEEAFLHLKKLLQTSAKRQHRPVWHCCAIEAKGSSYYNIQMEDPQRPRSAVDFEILNAFRLGADIILTSAETVRREGYTLPRVNSTWEEQRKELGHSTLPTYAILTRDIEADPRLLSLLEQGDEQRRSFHPLVSSAAKICSQL